MEGIDCEKLISEVFKHPILYDQSLSGYRDNDRKNNVWTEISASLDCNGM